MAIIQMVGHLPEHVQGLLDRVRNPAPALDRAGSYLVSASQRRIGQGGFAPNSPLTSAVKGSSKPLLDRGLLRNSLTHRVESGQLVIGSNHPGAGILHQGGTITAKSAKTLLIPASNVTRSLQRRFGFSPRDVLEGLVASGYAIVWRPKAVLARAPKGNLLLVFIRRKSVTVPARPFLIPETRDLKIVGAMILNYLRDGR